MGTITARAPASSALPMWPESQDGTRTIGVDAPIESTCSIGSIPE